MGLGTNSMTVVGAGDGVAGSRVAEGSGVAEGATVDRLHEYNNNVIKAKNRLLISFIVCTLYQHRK